MKNYSGNKEPYIYGLFIEEDKETALKVLEFLDSKNFKVSYGGKNKKDILSRSSAVLAFLSNKMINDKGCLDDLSSAFESDKTVIAIFLEPCELTPGLSMMLGQTQGILKYQLNDEELYDRLLSSDTLLNLKISDQQKAAAKKRSMTSIAAIIAILITALLIILLRNYILNGPDSLFGWLKRSKISPGPYEIDLTREFNPRSFFTDLAEDAEVTYEIDEENSTISIYVKTGDKTESFEDLEVTLSQPEYTIDDNIVIDKYMGYDVRDFVHTEQGVDVTSDLDEQNSSITINLSKGIWKETVEKPVTIDNSSLIGIWVSDSLVDYHDTKTENVIVFLEDHVGFSVQYPMRRDWNNDIQPITWTDDGSIHTPLDYATANYTPFMDYEFWFENGSLISNCERSSKNISAYHHVDSFDASKYIRPWSKNPGYYDPEYKDLRYDYEKVYRYFSFLNDYWTYYRNYHATHSGDDTSDFIDLKAYWNMYYGD